MDEPNLIDCQTDLERNALACEMCRRWCSVHSKLTICQNESNLEADETKINTNLRSKASIRQHNSPQLSACRKVCTNERFGFAWQTKAFPSHRSDLIWNVHSFWCYSCKLATTSVRNANLIPTKSILELKKKRKRERVYPRSHCFLFSPALFDVNAFCNAMHIEVHIARAICEHFDAATAPEAAAKT